ncbi:MAG: hypothetical protein H7145_25225 [Akkermansiaceae bacterium]|nr:hypothetical protein [Armatimonadota bacterium]
MNRLAFLCLLLVFFVCPTCAQETTPIAKPVAKLAPTFAQHLTSLWNPNRGLLLAACPADKADRPLGTEDRSAETLSAWLAQSRNRLRVFGKLSAINDARRSLDIARPELSAEDFGGRDGESAASDTSLFLASLTYPQWQKMASPNGLGKLDLKKGEQQTLWEAVIPNPFVVERRHVSRRTLPEEVRRLTDSERQQVRLRIKLIGDVFAKLTARKGMFPVLFHKNRYERWHADESHLELETEETWNETPVAKKMLAAYQERENTILARTNVPPLPRAVNSEKFAATITLSPGPQNERLTIAAVLERIRVATGQEIHCHPVLAKYVVVTAGTTRPVRAWDALRAVLFSTGTALRVLPPVATGEQPVLLLTPSVEPLGRREGRKNDKMLAESQEGYVAEEQIFARIAAMNVAELFQFDADDPLPLNGELRERVFAASRRSGERNTWEGLLKVRPTELPQSAQHEITRSARRLAESYRPPGPDDEGHDYRVSTATVKVNCFPCLAYIVPGSGELAGEVDGDSPAPLSEWLPSKEDDPAPVTPDGRVLIVAPETPAEAATIVRSAIVAKSRELWVEAAPPTLSAAIQEAAGRMPVRAVVSLLRVSQDTPKSLPRDVNIYGEVSRDWLVPDDSAVIDRAVAHVREVAQIGGLAGIVLRDIAPPGYRGARTEKYKEMYRTGDVNYEYGSGRLLGYTLRHRRAFAIAFGHDPADTTIGDPSGDEGVAELFFDRADTAERYSSWYVDRMQTLWESVRKSAGTLPLLVEGEGVFRRQSEPPRDGLAYFLPWDTAEQPAPPLPDLFRSDWFMSPPVPDGKRALAVIVGNRETVLPATELVRRLKRDRKPEETVLDLTDRKRPHVAGLLRDLVRAANPTVDERH